MNLSGTTVYTTAYAGATEVLLTGTQRITKGAPGNARRSEV